MKEKKSAVMSGLGAWRLRHSGFSHGPFPLLPLLYLSPPWDPSPPAPQRLAPVRRGEESASWGPHAGRAPQGYQRSDARIREDICERLTDHPAIDASDIEVAVKGCEVTLSGTVESRAVKHLVETMAETVPGVRDIHNQLRVAGRQQGGGQTPAVRQAENGRTTI